MTSPQVSVILRLHDGPGSRLAATLESLLAQTQVDWEAVIVDDSPAGTIDLGTLADAGAPRWRVVRQAPAGAGAARNGGFAAAAAPLVLFADDGDLLHPEHLARLAAALAAEPDRDAALCGWHDVDPGGHEGPSLRCLAEADLFPLLARQAAFPVCACLVRRGRIEQAGGFDADLRSCGDWDLWQRIARAGTRFTHRPEPLAARRIRPGAVAPEAVLAEGLRIIARGHAAGPAGRPALDPAAARLRCAAWCAGLALGLGVDPRPVLGHLGGPEELRAGDLAPHTIARAFAQAIPLAAGRTQDAWGELWTDVEKPLDAFLGAVEALTGVERLARRVRAVLERLAAADATARPLDLGRLRAVHCELTAPLAEISIPSPATETLYCDVTLEGEALGALELPVFAGRVPAPLLADAIAARFAGPILERLYGRCAEPGDGGGFLAAIWGEPDGPAPPADGLAGAPGATATTRVESPRAGWLEVEASSALPAVDAAAPFELAVRVGGAALGAIRLPAGTWSPGELRAAIARTAGFELCRAAVRAGILGRPLDRTAGALRERLASAAREAAAGEAGQGVVVLGRHRGGIATAASRRAELPAAALAELLAAAAACAEPIVRAAGGESAETRVAYAPDLLWPGCGEELAAQQDAGPPRPNLRPRGPFEALFASRRDPWGYGSTDYETHKYQQTLALLPSRRIRHALEIGCAEGHFTALLAPKVDRLSAADVSQIALARAAERCQALPNVSFLHFDLMRSPLPTGLDLVVAGEVLYYLPDLASLHQVAKRLAAALAPGGHLLTTNAHMVVDDPESTGFDWGHPFGGRVIGEALAAADGLQLVRELRTPLYRVQLFRRATGRQSVRPPRLQHLLDLPDLPPRAARQVRWGGGQPSARSVVPDAVSPRLPSLLYHSVAPAGPTSLARYRVTPQSFGAQLAFLKDAGYTSPCLADWRRAAAGRQPLPGLAVLLTFDDGYRDFADFAWPLLRKYGFPALVFLVAEEVGGTSRWDESHGESLPLLGWEEIRQLQSEGVHFGSHSARHVALTGLTPTEVVQQAAGSRALLSRGLGRPVEAFAYPHGDLNASVSHLLGACGYLYGFTSRMGSASLDESLLTLPRIEIAGEDDLSRFVHKMTTHGTG
jgi:peptidoglycan/xylan/chitin deacetylase (PgdA/CDA1 family)/SAM-dependent methyltransferase